MGNQLLLAQAGVDVGPSAFQDFFHLPSQAVSLVEAANLRIAIARAQQTGKLAVAVKTFVVHFHHADVVETGEDVFQPRREWVEILDRKSGNAVTRRSGAVHGFPDWALGRAPAHEQQVAFGWTIDFGDWQ